MDALNYILFKNPVVTYSSSAVKYAVVSIFLSSTMTKGTPLLQTEFIKFTISADQWVHGNPITVTSFECEAYCSAGQDDVCN